MEPLTLQRRGPEVWRENLVRKILPPKHQIADGSVDSEVAAASNGTLNRSIFQRH